MAEETQTAAPEATTVAEVVVAEAPPPTTATEDKKPVVEEEKAAEPEEKKAEGEAVVPSASFKEESNVVADLVDPEKKALDELKQLVRAALDNNEFNPPPPPPAAAVPVAAPAAPAEEKAPTEEGEEIKPADESDPAPEGEEQPKPSEPAPPAAAAAAEEPLKAEVVEEPAPPAKEEEPLPPPPPAVEEKAVTAEDDGSKTVEAIEETVVPVAAPPSAAEEAVKEPTVEEAEAAAAPPEEVFIWGVPLLGDERSDTILLKFLRARNFKVKEALAMLKDAVIWRKQFGIDALLEEDLDLKELEKVVYTDGIDKEGHPVCYNVYGEFQNKELYDKTFGSAEKRRKFLNWRIQYLEKGIREHLDFTPGGISSMVQVTDLRNSPRIGKHRQVTRQAVALLQDNYPEFIAKKVFINVPWWYLAVNRMMSPFFTQRTKSKFVFAGPSKSAETLFKYIAPEQVPVAFGGLNKHDEPDFTTADAATEVALKPSSKESIEIPATEACSLVWELRVLGWEVSYGAEFTPNAEDGYTVFVQKARKLAANDEPVIKGSFKIGEPGKVVLNIENLTSKKKKLLYRWKASSSTESTQ